MPPDKENPAPRSGGNGALKTDRLAGAITKINRPSPPSVQAPLPWHAGAVPRRLKTDAELFEACEFVAYAARWRR